MDCCLIMKCQTGLAPGLGIQEIYTTTLFAKYKYYKFYHFSFKCTALNIKKKKLMTKKVGLYLRQMLNSDFILVI